MDEHIAYHALAVGFEGAYHALQSARAQCGTWVRALEERAAEEGWRLQPAREWEKVRSAEMTLVLFHDDAYPPLLREIPFPPFGIYVKGNLSLLREPPTVALVGTRNATAESKDLAREFAHAFASAGCTVVSGLALGIDAAAHRGALEAGGNTVAVLGCGADRIYPRLHEKLGKEILASGGTIVSEYPPGSPSFPYRFLERNRIVSGLSRGVVIVEAPSASGALVTARFAVEQNRDVCVVPGYAKHPNFRGSHRLIREGATLVVSPEEVLDALGISSEAVRPHALFPTTPEAERVLAALESAPSSLSVDRIIEVTTLNAKTVNQMITFLLIQGKIKEEGGGYTLT